MISRNLYVREDPSGSILVPTWRLRILLSIPLRSHFSVSVFTTLEMIYVLCLVAREMSVFGRI